MDENPSTEEPGGDRIAKVLARAGIASRRDAERMIAEGRVKVSGVLLTTPAFKVPPGAVIQVDGKVIAGAEPTRMWRYYKPPGLVTTHRDEKDRPTVFQHLPPTLPRVISIGRLDLNSEGLLLLTNDGALSRRLELPETGWLRRYRVRFFGSVAQAELDKLKDGLTVEGQRYGPIEALLERSTGQNAWAAVSLREGKNREVRKVFEHLGLRVSRLIRIAYGPFQLGDLREGEVAEISGKVLKEQLGLAKNPRRTAHAPAASAPVIPAESSPGLTRGPREPGSRGSEARADRGRGAGHHPPPQRGGGGPRSGGGGGGSAPTRAARAPAPKSPRGDKGHRRLFSSAREASADQTKTAERAAPRGAPGAGTRSAARREPLPQSGPRAAGDVQGRGHRDPPPRAGDGDRAKRGGGGRGSPPPPSGNRPHDPRSGGGPRTPRPKGRR